MNWNELTDAKHLEQLTKESHQQPIIIFKHSTSCSISRTALTRFERNWDEHEMKEVKPYFLDLLSYRKISNTISDQFSIEHESPQLLLIRNGSSIYDRSHFDIDYKSVKSEIERARFAAPKN
jgi:bacillithiol system protein YtxJ